MQVSPIVIERLSHSFGEGELRHQVLYEVDTEVQEGEIVLLTGPSGSGKTTLLTLIGALRSAQEGSLRVLGRELRNASRSKLVSVRRRIGYIFQSHNLIDALSARENVLLALQLDSEMTPEGRFYRATEMLGLVGLAEHVDHLPQRLSGGQRQRVAIARALASRPRIVLADEPTASLDRDSGRDVIERIRDLAREEGVSVLVVTHDDRILDVADRILHLEDGRLATSYAEVVATSTMHLMDSLTRTTRRDRLFEQIETLPRGGFHQLMEDFTEHARSFLDAVRSSQSQAHEGMLENVLLAFTRKIGSLLDAERATLFLVDPSRNVLWTKYAGSSPDTSLEIELAMGQGIAGHVASTRTPMSVVDAYEEPLFDRSVDLETGYRTRSILCAPVFSDESETIAVAQVLNKRGGGTFSPDDLRELIDFAQSISVILQSWIWQRGSATSV